MSLLYTVAGGAASPGFMDGTFLTNSTLLALSFSYLAQI
jgi:hypothetical protein